MIRALLTDLDGVLRLWPSAHERTLEQNWGLPAGAIRQAAFAPELLLPAITGQVTDGAWRTTVAERLANTFAHLTPSLDAVQLVQAWSAPCGEVDLGMLELLRRCRTKVTLVLVTNATSRLPADLQQLGLAAEFDHVVNSSAVGYSKPDRQIFDAALAAAKVTAAEALFVDDSAANVAAAMQLGISGHHYRELALLQGELKRIGVG
ncbi:MAG: HAD-IA family hydrolase [Caldilineaceae bacterium]